MNDPSIAMASLWNSVIGRPEDLIERVRTYTPARHDFDRFKEELLKLRPGAAFDVVDVGFKTLVLNRITRSGIGWMARGPQKDIAKNWLPERIIEDIRRLHTVFATNGKVVLGMCQHHDPLEIISTSDARTLLFVAPPHYQDGHRIREYSFPAERHRKLAEVLRRADHQWILSYDDCPAVRDLYPDASMISFQQSSTQQDRDRFSPGKPQLLIANQRNESMLEAFARLYQDRRQQPVVWIRRYEQQYDSVYGLLVPSPDSAIDVTDSLQSGQ
jgi:DNA adenine methylase